MNSNSRFEAARQIRIRGRVQGVYFRASTAQHANALSVRGCVENLSDGSVRVLAAGTTDALGKLIAWLQTGPPLARVDEVEVEVIDPASVHWPTGFQQK